MPKKPITHRKTWAVQTLRKSYESHLASLSCDDSYDLLEELSSGTIITHLTEASVDELKTYVRRTFIEISPPSFIIRRTLSNQKAVAKPSNIITKLYRRIFND